MVQTHVNPPAWLTRSRKGWQRVNGTWNWSAPRANWSVAHPQGETGATHGPKAYTPVKDAAWAAAHPKRQAEADAWAQAHPKLAELGAQKHAEAQAWLHAHPKLRLSDRPPEKAAEAAARVEEANAWAQAHPREAKTWLQSHPKKSLVQHLDTLDAEDAEAEEEAGEAAAALEALEEEVGKPA